MDEFHCTCPDWADVHLENCPMFDIMDTGEEHEMSFPIFK